MQPLILLGRCWQEGDSKKSAATSLQRAMGCHHSIPGLLLHVKLTLCSLSRGGPERKVYDKSPYQCLAHMPQAHGRYLCHQCRREKRWPPAAAYTPRQAANPAGLAGLELHAPQLYHTWKHAVPAASVVPSSCPATHQSALRHSPRCASATPSTCTELSPSPPAAGSREC